MSVEETPPEGDREPRAGGPSSPSSPAPSARARGPRPDDRFVCSICLETVDDSPVVTLCGHLFCWPCLYEWLRPGMTAEERAGAFGRGTAGVYAYDPRPADANRRRCPVCSAPCAVGTVVPVYIQSAVEAALEEREAAAAASASAADGAGRDARPAEASRADGLNGLGGDGLDVDDGPQVGEDGGDTTTPAGSPRHRSNLDLADGRLLDGTLEAPVLGLRQRRGASGRPASDRLRPEHDDDDDDDFAAFTPVRSNGANLVDGFDAARIRSLGGDRSSADSTPVQHNRGPVGGGGAVPSRPSPRVERGRDSVPPVRPPRRAEGEHAAATPTSSPFRTALRPRRPRGPDGTAGPYSVPSGRGQGRLTSALLGMIDSFDAAGGGAGGDGGGGGSGARTAPRLHRSDGGLGGTGPERPGDGGGSGGRRDDLASAGAAQEFLSRLLLMLACFVVLCLLLF